MMYVLLKRLRGMPLTQAACEGFLLQAAKLVIVRELTLDDWVYLLHLVVYRVTTRCGASDNDKALIARTMRRIASQKDELGSVFN